MVFSIYAHKCVAHRQSSLPINRNWILLNRCWYEGLCENAVQLVIQSKGGREKWFYYQFSCLIKIRWAIPFPGYHFFFFKKKKQIRIEFNEIANKTFLFHCQIWRFFTDTREKHLKKKKSMNIFVVYNVHLTHIKKNF